MEEGFEVFIVEFDKAYIRNNYWVLLADLVNSLTKSTILADFNHKYTQTFVAVVTFFKNSSDLVASILNI